MEIKWQKAKSIICVVILLLFSFQLNAASTSPSQTVPKVLEDIEKEKNKKLDNHENLLNGLKILKLKKINWIRYLLLLSH